MHKQCKRVCIGWRITVGLDHLSGLDAYKRDGVVCCFGALYMGSLAFWLSASGFSGSAVACSAFALVFRRRLAHLAAAVLLHDISRHSITLL